MLAGKLVGLGASRPIQYVGGYVTGFSGTSANTTITFGGNLTNGLASSASDGDLVVVYFGTASGANRDLVVSGYTEITELNSVDTTQTNLAVAYKFMGSTPDSTFVLTGGTGNTDDGGAVAVQVWRNVRQSNPLDVAATTATGASSVRCDPPAITPSTTGAVIVAGGAGGFQLSGAGPRTFSSSDLTDFRSTEGTDINDVTIGLGYSVWTSGAFNPAQFTFSSADDTGYSWAGVTLALCPA